MLGFLKCKREAAPLAEHQGPASTVFDFVIFESPRFLLARCSNEQLGLQNATIPRLPAHDGPNQACQHLHRACRVHRAAQPGLPCSCSSDPASWQRYRVLRCCSKRRGAHSLDTGSSNGSGRRGDAFGGAGCRHSLYAGSLQRCLQRHQRDRDFGA